MQYSPIDYQKFNTMKLRSLAFLAISVSLFMTSCTKDTGDVENEEEMVNLSLVMVPGTQSISEGNLTGQQNDDQWGKFTWTGGHANVSSVKFQSLGNFRFEFVSENAQYINLLSAWNTLGQIQVPAVTMDSIVFTVILNPSSGNPSLHMLGNYERGQNSVALELIIEEPLNLTAIKNSPTSFSPNTDHEAVLTMALEWLAKQIPDDSIFFNAEKENGVVKITKTTNTPLYDLVWERLNQGSLTVDIDKLNL